MLLSGIFNNADKNITALLNSQNSGVQADVVVLRLAPGTAGIVLIIYPAALILLLESCFRALFRFTVETDNALCTIGRVSKDVGMEGIGTVLQNVVGIPAYDDTGTLIRQLEDYIALDIPKEVSSGQAVHYAGYTLRCKGIGEKAAARGVFPVLFNKFGRKTGFQSNLVYQFLVIEGDTKLFCNHASNGTSAGTKFTADGNDFLFHTFASFREFISDSLRNIIVKVLANVNKIMCFLVRVDRESGAGFYRMRFSRRLPNHEKKPPEGGFKIIEVFCFRGDA